MTNEVLSQTEVQRNDVLIQSFTAVEKAWEALGRAYSVNMLGTACEAAQDRITLALDVYNIPGEVRELIDNTMMLERIFSEIHAGSLNASDARWLGESFPRFTSLMDQVRDLIQSRALEAASKIDSNLP